MVYTLKFKTVKPPKIHLFYINLTYIAPTHRGYSRLLAVAFNSIFYDIREWLVDKGGQLSSCFSQKNRRSGSTSRGGQDNL